MRQRVIVTGATGTIGGALVPALLERGHDVVVFSRRPERARDRLAGATEYVAYSQGERGEWAKALAGASAVVNLAGGSIFRPLSGRRHLRRVTEERVAGTRALVGALRTASHRPLALVGASSIGVYGFADADDEAIDEHWTGPHDPASRGSREWESAALEASPWMRVVLLRMGFVLSHRGGGLPYQLERARQGSVGYFAPGSQWLPWIHLDDVVAVVIDALEQAAWTGPYNLVSPEAVRSEEFARRLAALTGAKPRKLPRLAARLLMGAGADTVLCGRRVVPARLLASAFRFRYATLDAALRQTLVESAELLTGRSR